MSAETVRQVFEYRKRGWNALPIHKNSKAPIKDFSLSDWLNGVVKDEEAYKWTSHSDAGNVAVALGPTSGNLLVVDVDDLSKVAKYQNYNTLKATTPSGGLHLFFINTTGHSLPNGKLENGVEVFTNNHYVLVEPSFVVSERAGKRYSGSYKFVNPDVQPAPFPPQLIAALYGAGAVEQRRTGKYTKPQIYDMLRYLKEQGEFLPGQHNDTIMYGAMVLYTDGWTEEAITEMFLEADQKDPTPQGEQATRTAIRDGIDIARRSQEAWESRKQDYTIRQAQPAPQQSKTLEMSVMTASELDAAYGFVDTTWLVDGWLVENAVLFLAAPPESYKTWLAIDLALSITTGLPFLEEFEVRSTGPVLIIQQEDDPRRFARRLSMVRRSKVARHPEFDEMYYETDDDGVVTLDFGPHYKALYEDIIIHHEGQLSFENPASLEALGRLVERYRPRLVIIDPFYSLAKAENFFAEAANVVRGPIKQLRNKYNCGFLFVHHTKKGAANPDNLGNREMMYGSNLLNAASEGVLMVRRSENADNAVVVYKHFKEEEGGKPVGVSFTINSNSETEEGYFSPEVVDIASVAVEEEIIQFIRDYGGRVQQSEIHAEFEQVFPTAEQLKRSLRKIKAIASEKEGRNVYWYIKPELKI